MGISKAVEIAGAGQWPARRHNQRERQVIKTVESFVPASAGAWTSAPTSQDAALNELASRLGGLNVVSAQLFTTVGGAAAEAITVTGAVATDVVIATINTVGAVPRTIASAVAGANTVTITFDGDPAADHVVNLLVVRA